MKIVIIGASFAGISCALELRKINKEIDITIIEQKDTMGYFSSGLVQTLKGNYDDLKNVRWMDEEKLVEEKIRLYLNEQVKKINAQKQQVQTDKRLIDYDFLVLASGAKISPEHDSEVTEENYFTVGQLKKDWQLLKKIEHSHVITILGAGTTGVELADVLCDLGKKVRLIEQYKYPLFKYFDEEFLTPFIQVLASQPRLETYFNQHAQLNRSEHYVEISIGKKNLPSEVLIFSGSLQPNHAYLSNTVSLHSDRTIRVNDQLQTSIPTIYAIGNLIQQKFPLTNDWYFMPSKENAIRTGIAVARILMKKQEKYEGSLRPMTMEAFGYYLGSVGLLHSEAFLYEGEIERFSASYCVHDIPITIQYVYDSQTKQLLGVQIMNQNYSLTQLVHQFEVAIYQKSTLESCLTDEYVTNWQTKLNQSTAKKRQEMR